MGRKGLIFNFYNPNTVGKTSDYILKILMESGFLKLEKEIKVQLEEDAVGGAVNL